MQAPSPSQMPQRRPVHAAYTPTLPVKSPYYSLQPHARAQAALKGFTSEAVLGAANNPSISYESLRFPGQLRRIRGDIVAVCDPGTMRVITVYENVKETALREDQEDLSALLFGLKLKERSSAPSNSLCNP